jgi:hypothetical protein
LENALKQGQASAKRGDVDVNVQSPGKAAVSVTGSGSASASASARTKLASRQQEISEGIGNVERGSPSNARARQRLEQLDRGDHNKAVYNQGRTIRQSQREEGSEYAQHQTNVHQQNLTRRRGELDYGREALRTDDQRFQSQVRRGANAQEQDTRRQMGIQQAKRDQYNTRTHKSMSKHQRNMMRLQRRSQGGIPRLEDVSTGEWGLVSVATGGLAYLFFIA